MAGKGSRKAPSCIGCKHASDRHSERTRRWAKAKDEEDIDRLCSQRESLKTIGSRRRAKWAFRRLHQLQAEAKRKERELLATTSLGVLIH